MLSSVEIRVALCALLVCACNSGPEVVATQREDQAPVRDASPLFDLTNGCEPGQYKGNFATDVTDAGLPIQLDGPISFSLVQLPTGPERLLSLANDSDLSGSSSALSASFTATIQGGSHCVDGAFQTQIVNGLFSIAGGSAVTFEGNVWGDYYSDLHIFTGHWHVFLNHGPTQTGGKWTALLVR